MALGGLDLEALRAELNAARAERVALLAQASELDSYVTAAVAGPDVAGIANGEDSVAGGVSFLGFNAPGDTNTHATCVPTPTAATISKPRLSWGTPAAAEHNNRWESTGGVGIGLLGSGPGAAGALGRAPQQAHPGLAFANRHLQPDNRPSTADSEPDSRGSPSVGSPPTRGHVTLGMSSRNWAGFAGDAAANETSSSAWRTDAEVGHGAHAHVRYTGQGPSRLTATIGGLSLAEDGLHDNSSQQPTSLSLGATRTAVAIAEAAKSSSPMPTVASPVAATASCIPERLPGGGADGHGTSTASSPVVAGLPSVPSASSATPQTAAQAVKGPALRLAGPSGGLDIAAAAARAAAAAAAIATTGQSVKPWAAHHTTNQAGAGVDLEAHRRMVLKEVLAMLLGEPPGSAKLEHMQLSVDSVVAVARQRQGEAVAEAEERLRAGQAERQAKAVRAAEEKAAAALEALRKTAEEEKRKLQAKLDKFRGQLADVEKEKKSLSGKSGQQARDLKETKDGLMTAKQLLSNAQATAEARAKQLARAQADLERVRQEAEEAVQAAQREAQDTRAQAEAFQRDCEQQLASAVEGLRAEHSAAMAAQQQAHAAELDRLRAAADAAEAKGAAQRQALVAEVDALSADLGQLMSEVQSHLGEMGEDMGHLKTDLAAMRSALREEVGAIREAAYAAIGGFHAACRTAAKAHAERTAQLLGVDAAVQKLGPGGVAGLVADCEVLRGKLADLKGQLDRAQAELAAAGVAQRRLTADAELKTRELQMMAASQKDLSAEVTSVRAEAEAVRKERNELRAALEQARAQATKIKETDPDTARAIRSLELEVAAMKAALHRAEAAAAAARRETDHWQATAADAAGAASRGSPSRPRHSSPPPQQQSDSRRSLSQTSPAAVSAAAIRSGGGDRHTSNLRPDMQSSGRAGDAAWQGSDYVAPELGQDCGGTPKASMQRRSIGAMPAGSSTSAIRARRSTDTEVLVRSGEGGGYGSGVNPDCMLPPLPNAYSMGTKEGGAPLQQPDMDELMDVLQALDDSALRRSRALAGGGRRAWDSPGASDSWGTPPPGRKGHPVHGTPPKGPKGSGGDAGGMSGSPASASRGFGRAVSWSGPGERGGQGKGQGGGRLSSEGVEPGSTKKGSPYMSGPRPPRG